LRAVGFDDKGILQITLIASWFNYINRVADALGVGRDELLGLREENCSHRFFFSTFHFFEHFVSSDSNGKRPRGVSRRDGGGWD